MKKKQTYVEENGREKDKIHIAGELSSEEEYVHISTRASNKKK